MRVLITGANGFLGSHLVDLLLERRDVDVRVLVRKSSNLRWLEGKPVEVVYGDVTQQPDELAPVISGVDVVFHGAGVTKALSRRTFYEVNQRGTRRLILACLRHQTPPDRFVLVSSAGASGPSPTGEPRREDDDPRPVTVYGRSKLAAERVAHAFMDRLSIAIVRPGAIYGPRDFELLPYFKAIQRGIAARPMLHEGHANFGYADDVARAVWLAGTVAAAGSETFFVGGQNTTQVELAGTIARALDKRFVLPLLMPGFLVQIASMASTLVGRLSKHPRIFTFGNVRRFLARHWTLDLGKARRLLGYEPAFPLEAGIEEAVAWYRERELL